MAAPPSKYSVGLGLGANLGDAADNLRRAVNLLRAKGLEFVALSSLYATRPWGVLDQPDFLNACALARTDLAPLDLLELTQETERALGRTAGRRWGPRLIDIDILFYASLTSCEILNWRDSRLTLPHPEMTRRAFVLQPLAEIIPGMIVERETIYQLSLKLGADGVKKITAF